MMKKVFQLTVLLLLIGLTSCMSGFQNFSKQKFTGLKQMKPVKTESIDEKDPRTDPAVIAEQGSTYSADKIQLLDNQDEVNVGMLKKAIEDKEQIIVRVKGKTYRLENPLYDDFYKSVIGVMTAIGDEEVPREYVEILADSYENRLGKHSIYLDEIKNVRRATQKIIPDIAVVEKSNPIVQKDVANKDVSTNTGLAVKTNTRKQELAAINYRTGQGYKFHAAALVSILVMIIGLIFLFMNSLFIVGLVLLITGYAIGFVSRIGAAINFRIAKMKSKKLRKGLNAKSSSANLMVWVGLVLFSIPLLFIPLILAAIIVGASTPKSKVAS